MDIKLTYKDHEVVIDTRGAEMKSLKLRTGREIMWCANPNIWGKSSPVLFPMIGTLRGGKTKIGGEEYRLPKHGFARDYEFSHSQIAQNDAIFTFTDNEDTRKLYPFSFTLKMHYTLLAGRVRIRYSVQNNSETTMPFCIGAHPAIACPFSGEHEFSDYKVVFEHPEKQEAPLFNLDEGLFSSRDHVKLLTGEKDFYLSHNLFINDCLLFETPISKKVLLTQDFEKGVEVSWTGFKSVALWTPSAVNAPFICIEPWCGGADFTTDRGIFEEKRGIQNAQPGEIKKYELMISEVT